MNIPKKHAKHAKHGASAKRLTLERKEAYVTTEENKRKFRSTTMEIPMDAIFEDVTVKNVTRLEVLRPGKASTTVPIENDETLLGRDKKCHVVLDLVNVSRVHARILSNGEDFILEDMNSTNGTFVNNVRIIRCVLHDNDQIRIGEARLVFFRQKTRMI